MREAFAVPRRTKIVEGEAELEDEDLIPREEMVVTVTHGGYVKRTQLSAYRTQHRGGKGKAGMSPSGAWASGPRGSTTAPPAGAGRG